MPGRPVDGYRSPARLSGTARIEPKTPATMGTTPSSTKAGSRQRPSGAEAFTSMLRARASTSARTALAELVAQLVDRPADRGPRLVGPGHRASERPELRVLRQGRATPGRGRRPRASRWCRPRNSSATGPPTARATVSRAPSGAAPASRHAASRSTPRGRSSQQPLTATYDGRRSSPRPSTTHTDHAAGQRRPRSPTGPPTMAQPPGGGDRGEHRAQPAQRRAARPAAAGRASRTAVARPETGRQSRAATPASPPASTRHRRHGCSTRVCDPVQPGQPGEAEPEAGREHHHARCACANRKPSGSPPTPMPSSSTPIGSTASIRAVAWAAASSVATSRVVRMSARIAAAAASMALASPTPVVVGHLPGGGHPAELAGAGSRRQLAERSRHVGAHLPGGRHRRELVPLGGGPVQGDRGRLAGRQVGGDRVAGRQHLLAAPLGGACAAAWRRRRTRRTPTATRAPMTPSTTSCGSTHPAPRQSPARPTASEHRAGRPGAASPGHRPVVPDGAAPSPATARPSRTAEARAGVIARPGEVSSSSAGPGTIAPSVVEADAGHHLDDARDRAHDHPDLTHPAKPFVPASEVDHHVDRRGQLAVGRPPG